MLTGYFKPSSGSIKIDDLKMPKDAIQIKSLIGYLPESAPLYHNMLVYDYLEYVAKIKGIIDKETRYDRFLQLSDLCGLSSIMAMPIANLSKGLKQRVGLAHALMADPKILILDEPTSGLDPNQIIEIRDIIKTIGKEKTIIFSTHILSEAEATCDRIAIINKGKVVANDTTAGLKQNLAQESLIKLSLKNAAKDEAVSLLKGIHPNLDIKAVEPIEEQVVSFEIASLDNGPRSRDLCADIYLNIKATDWIIVQLTKQSQTLEKVFQELTKKEEV
jgi:ABC-2 type transport system ATP-binding protein